MPSSVLNDSVRELSHQMRHHIDVIKLVLEAMQLSVEGGGGLLYRHWQMSHVNFSSHSSTRPTPPPT